MHMHMHMHMCMLHVHVHVHAHVHAHVDSDACARAAQALMMLRCDWRQPGVVAATVERLRRALGFLAELPRRAADLHCLQGAVLQAASPNNPTPTPNPGPDPTATPTPNQQAVVAWHAARQQAEAAAAGAEAGSDAERRTLNSADGKRGEGARLLARPASPSHSPSPNPSPSPSPITSPNRNQARLGPEATLALAEAAADLRALIKVKVADDQDLKTAQQAVAEAAHFFVALQQEADGLGVGADEQLQHYVQ